MDSSSSGAPARFRPLGELQSGLTALPIGPMDRGRVALVVSRTERGRRLTLDRVRLTSDGGVAGDAWNRQANRRIDGQITVMEAAVAELIANGQPLVLFGDNLFLDLDLSVGNLPPGSRVRVGGALMEVTPKPHNGCHKFRGRFVTTPSVSCRSRTSGTEISGASTCAWSKRARSALAIAWMSWPALRGHQAS